MIILPLATAQAQGNLDLTFSGDGKDSFNVPSDYSERWEEVAVQADGKIVLVGIGQFVGYLGRYNVDGTFDTSFGGTGWVAVAAPGWGATSTRCVLIQPDGKIVATGLVFTPGQVFQATPCWPGFTRMVLSIVVSGTRELQFITTAATSLCWVAHSSQTAR